MKIQETDIKEIYRVNTKKDENKPVIVDLTPALTKESLLTLYKKYLS